MNPVPERLAALRKKMQENNVAFYIVPTDDFHQDEYVGDHFKARVYITGFTGSAGTALITETEAFLWTDGRYFIQAAKELGDSTVELMKMSEPGVPTISQFLKEHVKHLTLVDSAQAAADLGSAKCLNVVLLGAAVRSGALGLTEEDIGMALEARLPEKLHALNRKALMYVSFV